MATALVRDLDDGVYERLKARAAGNNRSLEAELREILVLASKQVDMATAEPRPMPCGDAWRVARTAIVERYSPGNAFGERPTDFGSPGA